MKKTVLVFAIVTFFIIAIFPFGYMVGSVVLGKSGVYYDFIQLCLSHRTGQLIFNSISIGMGAMVLGLLLGVPTGFLISRTDIYMRSTAKYLVFLPILIPEYIAAMAWSSMLGNSSKVNSFVTGPFGLGEGLPSISGHWGVVWVLGLAYFPFVCLMIMTGLSTIDKKLEEQALLMAHPWEVIRRVTVPLIAPFMIAGALFAFIFSIANYGVPSLLRVNTYPLEIFTQFSVFYNSDLATLGCLPLLLVTLCLMLVCYFVMKDKFYMSFEGTSPPAMIIQLRKLRFLFSLFVWIVIFVSGILPLGVLMKTAGSFESYRAVFKTSAQSISTSLGLSALSATVCVTLGFYLGYILERDRSRGRRVLDIASLLPLAVPPMVLGIGLIELWNRPVTTFIYSGFLIVVFGLVARFVPFAVRILASCFKQLNPNMEEAAVLNGAGFFRIVAQILVPLTRQGILISWAICFIFCMGELGTTLLIVPAGYETLGNKIYTLLHYGVGKLTAALSVVQIAVTILPIVMLGILSQVFKESNDRT